MPASMALIRVPLSSPWAVASLVFGVMGMLGGFCFMAIPCLAAVLCGHIGLKQTKDGTRTGHAMAVAGLILGYLFVIPAIVFLVLILAGKFGPEVARIRQST